MKIEELTQKIYEDGIEKAKKLEEEALEGARKEADRIVADARQKADEVAQAAAKEAERSKAGLDRELKLAGDLAVAQVKKRIADCLVDALLPKSVGAALDDPAFMQQLILEIAKNWDLGRTNVDVEIVLSKQAQQAMADRFAAQTRELLDRGIEVGFSDDLKSGFRIQPKDGGYRVSFAEENFVAYFRDFLRERTRKVLFPENEQEAAQESGDQTGQQR